MVGILVDDIEIDWHHRAVWLVGKKHKALEGIHLCVGYAHASHSCGEVRIESSDLYGINILAIAHLSDGVSSGLNSLQVLTQITHALQHELCKFASNLY